MVRDIKIESFLMYAEDRELKKFKKRKDIEILDVYYTTEAEIFRICHVEYRYI